MRTTTTLSVLLTAALVLAGCAGGDETPDDQQGSPGSASPTASPSPTTPASPSPSEPTPSVEPVDAPLTEEPSAAPAAGEPIAVTDIEVTTHEGFDRVVLSIGGEGEAGWDVRYDDEPREQGSGRPIEVAGSAVLTVAVTGAALPPDAPAPVYDGPERLEPAATAITEVLDGAVFEGVHTFYVGVDEQRPYRIERREDPQRIVIDVSTG